MYVNVLGRSEVAAATDGGFIAWLGGSGGREDEERFVDLGGKLAVVRDALVAPRLVEPRLEGLAEFDPVPVAVRAAVLAWIVVVGRAADWLPPLEPARDEPP